jgi:hypothetical protein
MRHLLLITHHDTNAYYWNMMASESSVSVNIHPSFCMTLHKVFFSSWFQPFSWELCFQFHVQAFDQIVYWFGLFLQHSHIILFSYYFTFQGTYNEVPVFLSVVLLSSFPSILLKQSHFACYYFTNTCEAGVSIQ